MTKAVEKEVEPLFSDDEIYTIDGLRQDFPQALELMQFIWDKTTIGIELRGLSSEKKYQYAWCALTNKLDLIPKDILNNENPYIMKNDVIPEDPLRSSDSFKRDPGLPDENQRLSVFGTTNMPHPNKEAGDRKVEITYRKYRDGSLSYQVSGPVEKVPVGRKLNRFNQEIPDKFTWLDPRTDEIMLRQGEGNYTDIGMKHKTFLSGRAGGDLWNILNKPPAYLESINSASPFA